MLALEKDGSKRSLLLKAVQQTYQGKCVAGKLSAKLRMIFSSLFERYVILGEVVVYRLRDGNSLGEEVITTQNVARPEGSF